MRQLILLMLLVVLLVGCKPDYKAGDVVDVCSEWVYEGEDIFRSCWIDTPDHSSVICVFWSTGAGGRGGMSCDWEGAR